MFDIKGKVALISGGASGLGLKYAKEFLKNGLKGVTLADVNDTFGKIALKEIENEFGPKKAIYIRTDVTNKENFEEAFKETIKVFKNLDILINNAGIMNDAIWEKEIAININGVVYGTLLGLEDYIPKYKSGSEGVIVNISSVAGVKDVPCLPIYTATKFAVFGMSKAFGDESHFSRTKVRVLIMCPGSTETPLLDGMENKSLGKSYTDLFEPFVGPLPRQKSDIVALGMVQIIKQAKTGTGWVVEGGKEPYEFILPARESFAP